MRGIGFAVLSLFGALLLLAHAAALTICPACGVEETSGQPRCTHCGAALPVVAAPAADAPPPALAAPPPLPFAVSGAVYRAVNEDVQRARAAEAHRPAVALAFYENALALSTLAARDELAADAAPAIVEGMRRSRGQLAMQGQPCPACGGTGRRRVRVATLSAEEEARYEQIDSARCETCGGSGKTRAVRSVDAACRLLAQGRREMETDQRAAGRVALGRAWLPAGWPEALKPRQAAAVLRSCAEPCRDCQGLGLADCAKCGASGLVPCTGKGCRDGWIEIENVNSLTPKTAMNRRERCPVCNGIGRMPCGVCRGQGRLSCKRCKGGGAAAVCSTCGGEGLGPCRLCKGSGRAADGAACPDCHGERVTLCKSCHGDGASAR